MVKIFPLKLMTNYDKFKNFMEIIETPQHVHSYKPNNKYKTGRHVDKNYYLKPYNLENFMAKYIPALNELVQRFKRSHG